MRGDRHIVDVTGFDPVWYTVLRDCADFFISKCRTVSAGYT